MAKATDKNKKIKRPTAQKRAIQSEKKRLINRAHKAKVSTTVRAFETALKSGDAENIKKHLSEVYSVMDKAAKKGLFKKNKANRSKSRLTARAFATSNA